MTTSLLTQYTEMKRRHPDAVLLFRIGDFYECFGDDAIIASKVLGITLTRRANGTSKHVELAGFPQHALDTYLPKLVRAGRRVAICEQLEDPKITKTLVKRGITEPAKEKAVPNDSLKAQNPIEIRLLLCVLTQFIKVMEQLFKISEIRRRTEEIRELSYSIKLSPKIAFNACYDDIMRPKQKSLFD